MAKENQMAKNSEEYTVKYVFNEEKDTNINEIIKECFVNKLSNLLTK